jgi:hypothetical protein
MDVRHTLINGVSLLSENSKLDFPSVNLTAGVTCPSRDKGCVKCYAVRGNFQWANVTHAQSERLRWLQDCEARGDMGQAVEVFVRAIRRYPYLRWFGSGDMYNTWLGGVIGEVARATPNTQHWIATRTWRLSTHLPTLKGLNNLSNMLVRPSGIVGYGPKFRPHVKGLSGGAAVTQDSRECNCLAQLLHTTCIKTGCTKCVTTAEFEPTYLLH